MNRILLVVQCATLGLVAWGVWRPPAGEAEAQAAWARGQALEAEGGYPAAALAYERAALLNPGAAAVGAQDAARRARALACIAAADLPERDQLEMLGALATELEASTSAESQAAAPILRLVLARARGERAEADALVSKLAAGEKTLWFQWHAGALRLEEGRVAEAQELLEGLARARPAFGPGLYRLGLTYAAGGRTEAAIEALQRATAAGAGRAAELDLGRLFLKQEMWAEALPHLENALRAPLPAAQQAEGMRLVAAAHFHLKRFGLAARTYQQAYGLEPEPRTLLSAAIALTAGGEHAEAGRVLETLAPWAQAVPEIIYQQAVVAVALGQSPRTLLERYLAVARPLPGEADRVKAAEAALQKNPEPAAGVAQPPLPLPPVDTPPPPPRSPGAAIAHPQP